MNDSNNEGTDPATVPIECLAAQGDGGDGVAKAQAELLHIAVCNAVQSLSQGHNGEASGLLRQALVDYADKADSAKRKAAPAAASVEIYCSTCGKFQPLEMVDMGRWGQSPDNQVDHNWGDLLCSECHLVIATLAVSEPGVYRFVKVREIYADPALLNGAVVHNEEK